MKKNPKKLPSNPHKKGGGYEVEIITNQMEKK